MSNKSMTENSAEQLANGVQGGYSFKPDGKVIEYVNSKFIEYEKGFFANVDTIVAISFRLENFTTIIGNDYDVHSIDPAYIDNFKRLVGKIDD